MLEGIRATFCKYLRPWERSKPLLCCIFGHANTVRSMTAACTSNQHAFTYFLKKYMLSGQHCRL